MAINIAVEIAFNRIKDIRDVNYSADISVLQTWVRGYIMALQMADVIDAKGYNILFDLAVNAADYRKAELKEQIKKDLKDFKIPLDAPF